MRNWLTAIKGASRKVLVKSGASQLLSFLSKHERTVLTGTTVLCNASGIAVTYRNSPEIHRIISEARGILSEEDMTDERRKELYKAALKELAPLVAPIIFFFACSTTSAIVNHKKSEAKIAALSAALSIAQTTISEYDLFREEVKKELGEKKFDAINDEIIKKEAEKEFKEQKVYPAAGEKLFYIPFIGCYFSATSTDKVNALMNETNRLLADNDLKNSYGSIMRDDKGNPVVVITLGQLCKELGVRDEDIPEFAWNFPFRSNLENPYESRIDWCIGTADRDGEAIHILVIRPSISNWEDLF